MRKLTFLLIVAFAVISCTPNETVYQKIIFKTKGLSTEQLETEDVFEGNFISSGNEDNIVVISNEDKSILVSYYNESFPEVKPHDIVKYLNINFNWDRTEDLRAADGIKIVKLESENELYFKYYNPKNPNIWGIIQLIKS